MDYSDWKRHAEAVFVHYPQNKKLLEELWADVTSVGGGQAEPVSGGRVSDPVTRAIVALDTPRVRSMEREVSAVESVLDDLLHGVRWIEFVDLLFWQGQPLRDVAETMGIAYRTAKRWKKALLLMLAQKMGW